MKSYKKLGPELMCFRVSLPKKHSVQFVPEPSSISYQPTAYSMCVVVGLLTPTFQTVLQMAFVLLWSVNNIFELQYVSQELQVVHAVMQPQSSGKLTQNCPCSGPSPPRQFCGFLHFLSLYFSLFLSLSLSLSLPA